MKKIFLSALLGLGLVAGAATTTQAQDRSNVVKVNILSPIVSTFSGFYERKVADTRSVQLGVLYTGFSVGDTKFRGIGITPEYRFYLSSDEALKGFYIGPYLRYQNLSLTVPFTELEYDQDGNWTGGFTEKEGKASLNTFGGGVLLGYQFLIKDRVALDLFGGPGYNAGSVKVKEGNESVFETGAFDGFTFRTGIALGIAF